MDAHTAYQNRCKETHKAMLKIAEEIKELGGAVYTFRSTLRNNGYIRYLKICTEEINARTEQGAKCVVLAFQEVPYRFTLDKVAWSGANSRTITGTPGEIPYTLDEIIGEIKYPVNFNDFSILKLI